MSEPTETVAKTYTSLSAYMDMMDGAAAPDDVTIAHDAAPAPADTPVQTPDPEAPDAGAAPNPPPVDAAPPATVSEAARTLAQHGKVRETDAQKRTRQLNEQYSHQTWRKNAAKEAADAEEARLARLREEIARLQTASAPAPVAPTVVQAAPEPVAATGKPVAPLPQDVGTEAIPDWDVFQAKNQEFISQMAEWSQAEAIRVARETVQQQLAESRRQQEAVTLDQAWQARLQTAHVEFPDYGAVVFENPQLAIGNELADLIRKDPIGYKVAHYLGTHTEESQRIWHLAPLDQAIEFGRLKSLVSISATPVAAASQPSGPTPSAPVSKTPPPVQPPGGSSTSSQVPTGQRSLAEYIASENAKLDRLGRLS